MKTLAEALRDSERSFYKLSEYNYEEGFLSIGMDGTGFGMSAQTAEEYGLDLDKAVEGIEVGDDVLLWGKGLGSRVRGLAIGDTLFYYRTDEEDKAKHKAEVDEANAKKIQAYEETGKAELAERALKLPDIFQQRISGFHKRNPDFGWQNGSYETFVCEQAVLIADTLMTAARVDEFRKAHWELQAKMVPMLSDEHSGNTLGAAMHLANWYLVEPSNVPKAHGALCPLVGCDDYGCYAASEEAKAIIQL